MSRTGPPYAPPYPPPPPPRSHGYDHGHWSSHGYRYGYGHAPPPRRSNVPGCLLALLIVVSAPLGLAVLRFLPVVVSALVAFLGLVAAVPAAAMAVLVAGQFFIALWWSLRPERAPSWLAAPERPAPPVTEDDPAHRRYFADQGRADHAYTAQIFRGRVAHLLRDGVHRSWRQMYRGGWFSVLYLPVAVGLVAGSVAGGAVGAAAGALLLLLHSLLVWLLTAAEWATATVLLAGDAARTALRGIRMVCPRCYRRLRRPRHRCGSCGRMHSGVRPGRQGLLRRTCLCGARLPTLLPRAAGELAAQCPHCSRALGHAPGRSRELLVPLLGAEGAGKTRLMLALTAVFGSAAEEVGGTAEPADAESERRLPANGALLAPERMLNPTPDGPPPGLPVRFGRGRKTVTVMFFDTPGGALASSAAAEELRYLGESSSFVLAVDPLGSPAAWRSLGVADRERLARYRSRAADPMPAFESARDEIERGSAMRGRGIRTARLAVAVTRTDLLAGTPLEQGSLNAEEWARGVLGLSGLLRSARLHFKECTVFPVAAVRAGGLEAPGASALASWLLAGEDRALRSAPARVGWAR